MGGRTDTHKDLGDYAVANDGVEACTITDTSYIDDFREERRNTTRLKILQSGVCKIRTSS